jgi:hypothetical protein
MNRKYTLEDVEFIRSRANVTYDEAISLLDAYEGDVVRVMAELERSGKLRHGGSAESTPWETIKSIFKKGYEHRMIIRKGEKTIVNFSIIFWIIAVIFAFYVTIPALVIALLLGYRISFRNECGTSDDFKNMAYTAKENIKKAANTIRDEFSGAQTNAQSTQQQNCGSQQNAQQNAQPQYNPQPQNNGQRPDIVIE